MAAALLLAAAGCAPPLLYAPVPRERAADVSECAVTGLRARDYTVDPERGPLRFVAAKPSSSPALLQLLGPTFQERISVAVAAGPDSATLLVLGPYRQEKRGLLSLFMVGGFGGGRTAADDITSDDARAVLAACAPIAPIAPSAARCEADGKPLAFGELLRAKVAGRGEVRGTARALAGDTLTLLQGAEVLTVHMPAVAALHRLAPAPLHNVKERNRTIGVFVGTAAALAVGGLLWPSNSDPAVVDVLLLGPVLVLAGAGLGSMIGSATAGKEDPVWRWREIPPAACRSAVNGLPPQTRDRGGMVR